MIEEVLDELKSGIMTSEYAAQLAIIEAEKADGIDLDAPDADQVFYEIRNSYNKFPFMLLLPDVTDNDMENETGRIDRFHTIGIQVVTRNNDISVLALQIMRMARAMSKTIEKISGNGTNWIKIDIGEIDYSPVFRDQLYLKSFLMTIEIFEREVRLT